MIGEAHIIVDHSDCFTNADYGSAITVPRVEPGALTTCRGSLERLGTPARTERRA